MDIQTRPEPENEKTVTLSVRTRLYYALVDWSGRHRKWLPTWAKMLLLRMVRRKRGVEYMRLLLDNANKQCTKEQIEKAREELRKAGLL